MANIGTASGTGATLAAATSALVTTVNSGGGIPDGGGIGMQCEKNEITGQWTCIMLIQVS